MLLQKNIGWLNFSPCTYNCIAKSRQLGLKNRQEDKTGKAREREKESIFCNVLSHYKSELALVIGIKTSRKKKRVEDHLTSYRYIGREYIVQKTEHVTKIRKKKLKGNPRAT